MVVLDVSPVKMVVRFLLMDAGKSDFLLGKPLMMCIE